MNDSTDHAATATDHATATTGRFDTMIREMTTSFFRVTGVQPTAEQVKTVEHEIRQQFAGTQVYIAAFPKERARRLARVTGDNPRALAAMAGISERQARRVLRGK